MVTRVMSPVMWALQLLPRLLAVVSFIVVFLGIYLWSAQTRKTRSARLPGLRPARGPRSPRRCRALGVGTEEELLHSRSPCRQCRPCSSKPLRNLSMDMDHVQRTLLQCLCFSLWVGLGSFLMSIWGWMQLRVVQGFVRWGWVAEPSAQAMHRMAFQLAVDHLTTGLQKMERSDAGAGDAGEVAHFQFFLPIYEDRADGQGIKFHEQSTMRLCLDLAAKRVTASSLDGAPLSLADTVVVLAHTVGQVQRPKIHAGANRGVDPMSEQDPYLRKMSLITVCSNQLYFGDAPTLIGMLVSPEAGVATKQAFVAALKQGFPEQGEAPGLVPYSKHVSFITKIRHHFQEAFEKFRGDLPPSVNCEGLFLGTIRHSLARDAFRSALGRRAVAGLKPSGKYRSLHESLQVVRFLLAADVPTAFPKYYRDSPMAFHRWVYDAACLIDVDLANRMQSGIVQ